MNKLTIAVSAIAGIVFLSGCRGGYYDPYGYYDASTHRYVYYDRRRGHNTYRSYYYRPYG